MSITSCRQGGGRKLPEGVQRDGRHHKAGGLRGFDGVRRASTRPELDCLNSALDHWTAYDGKLDLAALLDGAFAALTLH